MELPSSTCWQYCSSPLATIILLLILVATNLSLNHASASKHEFRNETDRIALLEFKHQISHDPFGVLNSWNHSKHHCQWQGVTCGPRHQRVTTLTLTCKSLSGTISPHIGNLSFMKLIHLGENQFHGKIPKEVDRLFRLRYFNLSSNILSGEIPVNLSQCVQMITISLSKNRLSGKIPIQLGSLKKLEYLFLIENNLTGEIPSSIGNLSSLSQLSFVYNNLEGNLPEEIGLLTSLSVFAIGVNKLSGMIPRSIYNNSAITSFSITSNLFHGNLPDDIDRMLPNLQVLEFAANEFYGKIPTSVANLSKLEILEVSENNFEGQVPGNLGKLPNLQMLNIETNLLGNKTAGDLSFIASLTNCSYLQAFALDDNNFGGELPNVIGNLSSHLTEVYMGDNYILGAIPKGFGRLVNLFTLSMPNNSFLGVIPSDFQELRCLQYMILSENLLSGQIPLNLCNITSLYALYLSRNNFRGDITRILQSCQYLKELDVSQNNLTGTITPQAFGMQSSSSPVTVNLSYNSMIGSLPVEVGKLINLNIFDISYNKFSGEIPMTFGDCLGLEYLGMQNNLFQGIIPPNLASLLVLKHLDLSSNNLNGEVPRDLQKLRFLKYLNLSYNDLEGDIPTDGVFGNASAITLVGNSKVCGGIPQLELLKCVIQRKKKKNHLVVIVTSTLVAVILIFAALMVYLLTHRKRGRRKDSPTVLSDVGKILRISYHELYRDTEGFSSAHLIGSGSYGFVYKGRLNEQRNMLIAIKVLDIQKNGASKSFKAECRAVRNIRHRNIVSLLTYCSRIDTKGHEFKALVYQFMENGSLDTWLHPKLSATRRLRSLNLLQRLSIAIDVASALDYLHNYSEVAIVHCGLKPSNILLDNNLVGHVGDFGLAKLLLETTNNSAERGITSSAAGIKGTIGYTAPEYGMGLEASTEGDVYSFGILLLEMFTGRRPTDDTFMVGMNLHNYVEMNLPEHVWDIVDPSLNSKEVQENRVVELVSETEETNTGRIVVEKTKGNNRKVNNVQRFLISIFKVGLGCSERSPKLRMHIKEVTRELYLIRDAYFSSS